MAPPGPGIGARQAFEMETLVLGWFILVETGSVLLLTVFASLPFLGTLLAPMLGVVGDRIGHRRLMCLMRAFYLALAAVLAVLSFAGMLGPLEAFIVAGLAGLVRPSDVGLRNVLIGETMPADRLLGALGLSRITADSARAGGALAGAGVVATLGMSWAYVMIVAFYAISLVLTLVIGARAAPPAVPRAAPAARRLSPWGDLRAAINLVWATPPQLAAMSLAFLINLTTYPFILGLLPYVAREVYGTDQTGLGYMVAASAIGAVAASFIVSRFEHRVLPARVMFLATIAWQLLTIALAQTAGIGGGIAILVLVGIAQGLCIVPMAVLQLRNAPPELRGRITGLRTLAVYGLPIGLWISGPLIERLGFAAAATLYCGIGLACTLAMLAWWRRHLWPADAPANRRG
jgi:predicted MFS family arabinose efflux permease